MQSNLPTNPTKGVNLGGWLLMEGYILGGRNIAETTLKQEFRDKTGARALKNLQRLFRTRFINEKDIINIADMGAKVIRVPFHYGVLETQPFKYSREGFSYLKNIFTWAQRHKLKVILDLHAACGSQNYDWHGDNTTGKTLLWEKAICRERTYALWEKLAATFKDEPALYAYDVLNEPVMEGAPLSILEELYTNIIKRVRAVDKQTLIYLEGHLWSQRIDFLKHFVQNDIGVSIHFYHPLNYCFNFTPLMTYPGKIEGGTWNKNTLARIVKPYADFARKHKCKMFVGEFGINWRGGHFGEIQWLEDILDLFDQHRFDYTYWTYKAMANDVFPDGIYQYLPNSKYICREGPLSGFESYAGHWKTEQDKITDFWLTKNFTANKEMIAVLRKHFRK